MTSKPTLLLVDDEERILRSLRMLFLTGYNVLMTTDAHEALRILRERRVHVIVSDQRMPIMLGAELLRNACEVSPSTMRILLTGYSDFEASVASVNEGEVFRYLAKPWVGEDVKQAVAEAASIAEAAFAATPASAQPDAVLAKMPRVLIIDHDETTIQVVHDILRNRCEVIAAKNVHHALEVLAQENVAVVVADLALGDENVSSMLKTIKRFSPRTQTIVVTAFNDTGHLVDLINQAQISRYLPKPLVKGLLARNLDYVLGRFHALGNQPAMEKRQSVAPISEPQEKRLSENFLALLGSLRARASKPA